MPLRPLRIPKDASILGNLTLTDFDYPDHPEWRLQSEDHDAILDMARLEMQVHRWQTGVLDAALALGFQHQYQMHALGMHLTEDASKPASTYTNLQA
jgi:hypothetical protein